MKIRILVLASATIAALSLGIVPAAASFTIAEHDATHDLRHSRFAVNDSVPQGETQIYRARNHRDGDIQWMRLTQGSYNVRLRVHFVELRRIPKDIRFTVLGFNLAQTGMINTSRGAWQGYDTDHGDHLGGGLDARVTWRFDYESNDFYVTIPLAVFGDRIYGFRAALSVRTVPATKDMSLPYREQYYDDAMTGYQRVPSPTLIFSRPA